MLTYLTTHFSKDTNTTIHLTIKRLYTCMLKMVISILEKHNKKKFNYTQEMEFNM